MRAIATFATPPMFASHANPWRSVELMLACARESLQLAQRHFSDVTVYSDEYGARVLNSIMGGVDVNTELEGLYEDLTTRMWQHGKVIACSRQHEPFVHFDLDCLMIEPLPKDFLRERMGFQGEEPCSSSFYNLKETAREYSWHWSTRQRPTPNMGVYVCNDLDTNEEFCAQSMWFVDANKDKLNDSPVIPHPYVIEQYLMGEVCERRGVLWQTLLVPGESTLGRRYYHLVGALKHDGFALAKLRPLIDDAIRDVATWAFRETREAA